MSGSSEFAGPARVAVVGVGNVGASFAYALLLSGLAAEIVLIDANRAKAEGEAMDLNHAVPFSHRTRARTKSRRRLLTRWSGGHRRNHAASSRMGDL